MVVVGMRVCVGDGGGVVVVGCLCWSCFYRRIPVPRRAKACGGAHILPFVCLQKARELQSRCMKSCSTMPNGTFRPFAPSNTVSVD